MRLYIYRCRYLGKLFHSSGFLLFQRLIYNFCEHVKNFGLIASFVQIEALKGFFFFLSEYSIHSLIIRYVFRWTLNSYFDACFQYQMSMLLSEPYEYTRVFRFNLIHSRISQVLKWHWQFNFFCTTKTKNNSIFFLICNFWQFLLRPFPEWNRYAFHLPSLLFQIFAYKQKKPKTPLVSLLVYGLSNNNNDWLHRKRENINYSDNNSNYYR